MSVLIQTAPGELALAHLRGGTSTGDSGNGNVDNRANFGSVDSFLCPRPAVVTTASFATKNESTESVAAALEQSALHLFLAAEVPATIEAVS